MHRVTEMTESLKMADEIQKWLSIVAKWIRHGSAIKSQKWLMQSKNG
jgi:hypothetical protein